MDVLEDEHGWRGRLELAEQSGSDVVRLRAAFNSRPQFPVRGSRDVEQRTERSWRVQRIASGPHNPPASVKVVAEGPQQRGLSDPGFAAHERRVPARPLNHFRQTVAKHGELRCALKQPRSF